MKKRTVFIALIFLSVYVLSASLGSSSDEGEYDVLIKNGRVMDPLTRADFTAHVGIKDGKIKAILPVEKEEKAPPGADLIIDAKGLVVAPGFIDIHAHEGMMTKTMEYFVKDGRTMMIGGNCGGSMGALARYFGSLERMGLRLNYASFSGHGTLRPRVGAQDRYKAATAEQIEAMIPLLEADMEAGSLGVSYGIEYIPGSSYEEILALGKVAARYGGMTATHGRYGRNSHLAVYSLWEMVRLAKDTGAPHQYAHIGSMLGYGDVMDEGLDMLEFANAKGIRILADIYSYEAWNTGLGAAVLDEGFFERMNCKPEDIEVLSTVTIDGKIVMKAGDRFTLELFDSIRAKVLDGEIPDPMVIGHAIRADKTRLAIQSPYVVCGSDGAVSFDPVQKKPVAHPRTTNNFARFLGRWVREEGTMDLMTALFKTSTQAALHLGLTGKGRIAVGADADITIFNPDTISDRGLYGEGFDTPPVGIDYVLVNGMLTVSKGEFQPDIKAGKVIRRTWKIPGYIK
ncbi:amidohydrolase family protein [Acidobacteriota bacterium]